MKKVTAIFPGWLFPFVYCVAGVDAYLQTYASWAGTAVPDKLPGIPFANLDVFEDESNLRYRLFYLVPDTSSGELRCFFYLEDNLFAKEPNGDLLLSESTLHLFSP